MNFTVLSNTSITPSTIQFGSTFSTASKKRLLSLRATRRILAPYVKARKKPKVEERENKYFSFYVQKKPSILMKVMAKWCVASDLLDVMDETADVLKFATKSAAVTVYMVDETLDEIYQVTEYYEHNGYRVSYKIEKGTNVAAYVAFTKESVKIDDLLEDDRFPNGLGNSELTVKSVICVPVLTPEDDCIAVFELYREIEDNVYDDRDMRMVVTICSWVGAANYQNQQKVTLQKQQELNEYMLHLTECYFADAMLLDKLISEVVNFAKIALNAEHGLFYVLKSVNNDIYADFYEEGVRGKNGVLYKKNMKIKLNDTSNLVSIVAQKGAIINIKNAYSDSRVRQQKKGYKIMSVLCIPIKCVDQILGVLEIINKKKGPGFEKSDEILLQTFCDFCGFVLKYAQQYEKMTKLNSLNNVYTEMLAQQMEPCIHDMTFITNHPDIPSLPERFNQFDFYIPDAYEMYMPQLVMYMIEKTCEGLFESTKQMGRFVLVVRKSYKSLPYHNFHHAFNVCHCMYNIVRRNMYLLTALEIRALILSALCHDIDHTGLTNNYLELSKHPLSELYEDSILENHQYYVTSFIFKFLNLFSNMPPAEYKQFLSEVRMCILATDMATHFSRRTKLSHIYFENKFDFTNNTHRFLLKSLIMTNADLSSLSKPFLLAKSLVDKFYEELYEEGDQEKILGLCPLTLMDRDKSEMIPADQIQFMNAVVLPCNKILAQILPSCEPIYKDAIKLRDSWKEINDTQGQKLWTIEDSLPHKRVGG